MHPRWDWLAEVIGSLESDEIIMSVQEHFDQIARLLGFESPGRLVGEETAGWLRSNRFYSLW